jgi:hypothetical protein
VISFSRRLPVPRRHKGLEGLSQLTGVVCDHLVNQMADPLRADISSGWSGFSLTECGT